MNQRTMSLAAIALAILPLGSALSQAGIVFTIELPGDYVTSVAGVNTETFDGGAPTGMIGIYSGDVNISAADVYGGADGTAHLDIQPGSAVTLELLSAQKYFGMWWSAGHPGNKVTFFDGATELASFEIDILSSLPAAYFGNPVTGPFLGGNAGEPYAYLNFTATAGMQFDKILLQQIGGGGFESDNHSVTDREIEPPGNPLPLPDEGSILGVFLGTVASLIALTRAGRGNNGPR